MQTQTSNTLHNAIMEAGSKDRPPMLAPGNYVQWKSRIKRNIDTKPNHELIHYCLENPPNKLDWQDIEVPVSEGSPITTTERIRTDNDIYSTVDVCPNACEMWKAIERFYKMMNELIKNQCKVINHEVNVQFLLQLQPEWQRSQQAATKNRGKAIVNSPQPIYDQEPSMVDENDETSKDKEIDKLMALISLSFKKIYKPTNNNLQTSLNTSRANQENSPRINKSAGYENQRNGNVAGARENVGSLVVQKSRIQCYNCKEFGHVARECQKPKQAKDAAYHRKKMLLCKQVSNDDHYNMFAMESVHTEQSKSIHNTYPIKQDAQNVIIDSLDMNYDREEIDQNDDDNDLAKERELLASLIEKLKSEIDESKNCNKFLETSNKALVEKLKGEIEDFKNKNKSLESSNNFFKEANNKLSETNNLLYADYKKSEAELARRNSTEYASQIELECAKETIASESNKNPKNFTRKLYERVSKTCSCWYPKFTPSGYKWKPKSGKENVNPNVSMPLGNASRSANVMDTMTYRCSTVSNTPLSFNSFAARRDGPIHRDLVQGAVMIKRVYYVKGINHNLFFVGQLCDVDLKVAFRKSTCFIRDLRGNDLLTGSRGTDLYSITLQDTNCPNPICLMAKATSSQAWLWHRRLSYLNFETINLLSKNDIVVGLPMLKIVKDHLCSSCELGKAKRKSFHTKLTPCSKRQLQLLHMDLCGPKRVASINGKRYVLLIVDDYSRYTWTYFLRSKDETPEVLIDFLGLVQKGLQAQVRVVRTDKGTKFLYQTLHADGENLDKKKEKGDECIFM
nr:retrovirus-related Pol polyprotein from transposon TNT 1-94 [Tanacetum cinerariifolium]